MCQWLEQLPLYSLCSLTQPVPVALLGGYVVFWNLQNQGLSIGTESPSPWFLSWELPEGNTVLLCIAWLPCFPWEPWCKLWVFYQFKTSNMRCIPLDYGCRSLRVLCGQTLAVGGLWILNTQIFIFISILFPHTIKIRSQRKRMNWVIGFCHLFLYDLSALVSKAP